MKKTGRKALTNFFQNSMFLCYNIIVKFSYPQDQIKPEELTDEKNNKYQ